MQNTKNISKNQIKLFDISVDKKEEQKIIKILRSKFWASGSGNGLVGEFESKFKNFTDSQSCIAVNSGTAALHLALSLFDIKNKEVILPSLSFVSTAHAVILNGGIPKFVDVDPNTLCIDPNEINKKITKKTRLILPVHFAGMACDLKKILNICRTHSLFLVEDAAHAAGTIYQKKKIGSHGDAVCFSFHPAKNLAMPSGGAITLNMKKSAEKESSLMSKRWCGISNRKGSLYDVDQLGWNYYMNELSAGIGLVQLSKLHKNNSKRQQIARRLHDKISLDNKMPFSLESSYHFYWIRIKNRNNFIKKMKEVGIETGIHYKPIHLYNFYSKYGSPALTSRIFKEVVSLPCHANLSNDDVDRIIYYTNKFSK